MFSLIWTCKIDSNGDKNLICSWQVKALIKRWVLPTSEEFVQVMVESGIQELDKLKVEASTLGLFQLR